MLAPAADVQSAAVLAAGHQAESVQGEGRKIAEEVAEALPDDA